MNEATVYVWFGGDLKENFLNNFAAVGHVSLQYGSKTTDYISFWPASGKQGLNWSVTSTFASNYHEDCQEIKRQADLEIELNCLNKAVVQAFFLRFKSSLNENENRKFNILYSNCSTLISKALIIGSNLEKKTEGKGNWFTDINTQLLTLTTPLVHLEDQLVRLVGLRSMQASMMKIFDSTMNAYPSFIRKAYLHSLAKNQEDIWWSPYNVTFLSFLLKKELG